MCVGGGGGALCVGVYMCVRVCVCTYACMCAVDNTQRDGKNRKGSTIHVCVHMKGVYTVEMTQCTAVLPDPLFIRSTQKLQKCSTRRAT